MLDRQTLDDIIRRVVEAAQPEKIILFGSVARGDMGPNSDVDLLIIKEEADALNLMARIYRKLHGVGAAVDAIVVSPEDVERFKDSHALIIKPALREGRVVYEAARALRFGGRLADQGYSEYCLLNPASGGKVPPCRYRR